MEKEIFTFLLGMSPAGETRLAIPIALTVFHLSAFDAVFWGTLGAFVGSVATIFLLEPVSNFARKNWKWLDRFLQKVFERTRGKHSKNFERLGMFFFLVFVAIPLPGSGGYTAALVAWLFDAPKKIALPVIAAGLLCSSLIVLAVTTGAVEAWDFFNGN